jgi:hypothetical protein
MSTDIMWNELVEYFNRRKNKKNKKSVEEELKKNKVNTKKLNFRLYNKSK